MTASEQPYSPLRPFSEDPNHNTADVDVEFKLADFSRTLNCDTDSVNENHHENDETKRVPEQSLGFTPWDCPDVSTSTSIVVDNSSDGDFLRIDFNMSFPALSCEFASVDVSDTLGTNRLNITKTVRKYAIDSNLKSEFHSGPVSDDIKHDLETDEEHAEGSVTIHGPNFDYLAVSTSTSIVIDNSSDNNMKSAGTCAR